jgi:hypothetical protein
MTFSSSSITASASAPPRLAPLADFDSGGGGLPPDVDGASSSGAAGAVSAVEVAVVASPSAACAGGGVSGAVPPGTATGVAAEGAAAPQPNRGTPIARTAAKPSPARHPLRARRCGSWIDPGSAELASERCLMAPRLPPRPRCGAAKRQTTASRPQHRRRWQLRRPLPRLGSGPGSGSARTRGARLWRLPAVEPCHPRSAPAAVRFRVTWAYPRGRPAECR